MADGIATPYLHRAAPEIRRVVVTTTNRIELPLNLPSVAFDAGFLDLPPSGIGAYVEGLLSAFARMDDANVTPLRQPASMRLFGDRPRRLLWDAAGVEISRWWYQRDVDLLHIPAFSAPVYTSVPLVVTIHDVIPFVLPEYRASAAMRLYLALMRRTVRRAQLVLTPSHAAARDIIDVLGIRPDRVVVTPPGVDPALRPPSDAEDVRASVSGRFGIGGPYLFHIAGFDRRKNVPLLVRAFAAALPSLPGDTTLVLAGAPHSDNPAVFPPVEPVIHELGLEDRVVLTGRVTNDERRLLYQGASGYVTPSAYEGFGLTPLEAMASGVPVIAANRTSLPEVVHDAGLLVEPSVDALAGAIVRLMRDDALRGELRRLGLVRAESFTWERTAALTLAAYRDAVR